MNGKGEIDPTTILVTAVLMLVLLIIIILSFNQITQSSNSVVNSIDPNPPPSIFENFRTIPIKVTAMAAVLKGNELDVTVTVNSTSTITEDVYFIITSYPEDTVEERKDRKMVDAGAETFKFLSVDVNPETNEKGETLPFYVITTLKSSSGKFITKSGLYCDSSYSNPEGGFICY